MLTMAGSKMATRVAPSLLKAAGGEGLVVESLEEYEERAVSLATDPEKLFEVCRCCRGCCRPRSGFSRCVYCCVCRCVYRRVECGECQLCVYVGVSCGWS